MNLSQGRLLVGGFALVAILLAGCGGTAAAPLPPSPPPPAAPPATPTASPPTEVELATWALRVCSATALLDATTTRAVTDGVDVSALTLRQRVAREARINRAIADVAKQLAEQIEVLPPASGTEGYQAELLGLMGDLAQLLEETQARIESALSIVDVAAAYSAMREEFEPRVEELRQAGKRLDEPMRRALTSTERCAVFTGFEKS